MSHQGSADVLHRYVDPASSPGHFGTQPSREAAHIPDVAGWLDVLHACGEGVVL